MSRPGSTDQTKKDQDSAKSNPTPRPAPRPVVVPPGGSIIGRLILDKEGFVVGTIS